MSKNFYPRLFEFEEDMDSYQALNTGHSYLISKALDDFNNYIDNYSTTNRNFNLILEDNYIKLKFNSGWVNNPPDGTIFANAELVPGTIDVIYDFVDAIRNMYQWRIDKNYIFPSILKNKKLYWTFNSETDFLDYALKQNKIPDQFIDKAIEIFNKNVNKYITPDNFLVLDLSEKRAREILIQKPAYMLGKNYSEFDFIVDSSWSNQVLTEYLKTAIVRKNWLAYNLNIETLYKKFPDTAIKYMQKFKSDGSLVIYVKNNIPELFVAAFGAKSKMDSFANRSDQFRQKNLKQALKLLTDHGFIIQSTDRQKKNGTIKAYLPSINPSHRGRTYMIYKIGTLKLSIHSSSIYKNVMATYTDLVHRLIKYLDN